ncbi:MAG: hypothetical protein Q9195_004018 [Heterodermia aff. obscurata]
MGSSPNQNESANLLLSPNAVPLRNLPSLYSKQSPVSSRDITPEQDRENPFEATSFDDEYRLVQGQAPDHHGHHQPNDWSLKVGQTIVDRWLLEIAACGASIGAVVTILAIAVDPTVQQMVTVRSDSRNSSAAVLIGRAQSYLAFGDGPGRSWPPSTPAPDMYGAIYPGIFYGVQDATTAAGALDVIPSCPTGNCTFPPYQSLAVCSSCQDVSHALTHKCPATSYCEHSLPNGLRMNKTEEDDLRGAVATSGYLFPVDNVTLHGNSIFNFSRIRGTTSESGPNLRRNVTANQCFLYWCVNNYDSSVSDGHLNEKITSSWYANGTYWWSNHGIMNDERIDLIPPGISPSTSPNPNFTVAYLAHVGISEFLAQKLTLSNSIAISPDALSSSLDETSNASSYEYSQDLLRIFRDSEPDAIFANIAKSMTRNIRDQNASMQTNTSDGYFNLAGGGPAGGIAREAYIFVSVRWAWLAFSAVLVLLTCLFLGLTVLSTARHDVAVWKSSPIPLLFSGLEKEEADRLRRAKGLVEMERLSSGIRFVLKDDSGGGKGVRLAEQET